MNKKFVYQVGNNKKVRCTNFSNLFSEWKSTCFGTSWSCSQAVSKPVWHIPLLCVQWKTPNDGQSNCPKHVEFHSKNKFEKSVHLVGFIIGNLSRCTVTWTSNNQNCTPPEYVCVTAGRILTRLRWQTTGVRFFRLGRSPTCATLYKIGPL